MDLEQKGLSQVELSFNPTLLGIVCESAHGVLDEDVPLCFLDTVRTQATPTSSIQSGSRKSAKKAMCMLTCNL